MYKFHFTTFHATYLENMNIKMMRRFAQGEVVSIKIVPLHKNDQLLWRNPKKRFKR